MAYPCCRSGYGIIKPPLANLLDSLVLIGLVVLSVVSNPLIAFTLVACPVAFANPIAVLLDVTPTSPLVPLRVLQPPLSAHGRLPSPVAGSITSIVFAKLINVLCAVGLIYLGGAGFAR
jgi:hypothetical protein